MSGRNKWLSLLSFGAAVAGAGWIGAHYSPSDLRTKLWYSRLRKPSYDPPDYVFPIVWTGLYSLIAVSGARVWNEDESPERTAALCLWWAQLAMNAGWTRFFFGEHRPKRALVDVISMEAVILSYVGTTLRVDRTAAACFVPYAAWVAFATVLNVEIARLNPDAEELFPKPRAA